MISASELEGSGSGKILRGAISGYDRILGVTWGVGN